MPHTLQIKDGFAGERAVVLPIACVDRLKNHPRSRILYITDIGFYPYAMGHLRIRNVPIGEYVFIYCVDGAGWYSCNGARYEVKADSFFILPPGLPHSYGADSSAPWTIYWIHFNGDLARHYLPAAFGPIEIKAEANSRIADRLEIFDEIMACMERGFGLENLLYACSIFHHFLGSLRFIRNFRQVQSAEAVVGGQAPEADVVEAAMHFMNENIGKKLYLKDIAQYVGLSEARFSALFTAQTHMSPIECFNRLKVGLARRLLENTDLKINMICHKVGIHDQYYFSRLFSKVAGMSPTQCRNACGRAQGGAEADGG